MRHIKGVSGRETAWREVKLTGEAASGDDHYDLRDNLDFVRPESCLDVELESEREIEVVRDGDVVVW